MNRSRIAKDLWLTVIVLSRVAWSALSRIALMVPLILQPVFAKSPAVELQELLEKLQHGTPIEQRQAAMALTYPPFRKDPAAVDALIAMLDSAAGDVLSTVLHALSVHDDPRAIEPMVDVMDTTSNKEVEFAAAHSLGRMGEARAISVLVRNFGNMDINWRAASLSIFRDLADERALDTVLEALKNDPDGNIRVLAAYTLERFPQDQSTEALIAALGDEDMQIRRIAASSLAQHKKPEAINALIELISDPHHQVQNAANLAICQIIEANADFTFTDEQRAACTFRSVVKD